MNDSLDKIWTWLTAQKGQLIHISKVEDADEDKAELRLQDVVLTPHKDRDEYLSSQAFLLTGEGKVQSENSMAPLPYDFYEVPLTDRWSVETSGLSLQLKTERATYVIKAAKGG